MVLFCTFSSASGKCVGGICAATFRVLFERFKRALNPMEGAEMLMKRIDVPPLWLVGFLVIAYFVADLVPGLGFGGAWADFLGGVLIGGAVVLFALSIMEFRKHATTVLPHETPSALIQTGIYKRSRNPIYLADVLLLAGFILRWDAVLALPLIPIFLWTLERRFVLAEEKKLRRQFRIQYAAYCNKTRRWL